MFPSLFEKLDIQNFHYDICQLSKHHQVSFPLSNKFNFISFILIHTHVCGPINVQSIFGVK